MKSMESTSRREFLIEAAKAVGKATGLALVLSSASCAAYQTQQARKNYSGILEAYQNFQCGHIEEPEQSVIESVHKEYGPGPVDLSYLKRFDEKWIRNFDKIIGKKELDDIDLLFIIRHIPPAKN